MVRIVTRQDCSPVPVTELGDRIDHKITMLNNCYRMFGTAAWNIPSVIRRDRSERLRVPRRRQRP